MTEGRWRVHVCTRNPLCRRMGAASRVTVVTPWGSLILAGLPRDWVQVWLPWAGYRMWFAPVAWHPRSRRTLG